MTVEECKAAASRLKLVMNKYGVTCSIELQPGRGDDPWLCPPKPLRMQHHTGTHYPDPGDNLTPALWVVKNGRPDVVGPLCNGYGGYDFIYRIICMGLANHPGLGGPINIDGILVPRNSARLPTWGTEYEGGFEEWTPDQLEFMGRADAALAEYFNRPLTSQMEHSDWAPDRKIDRLHFDNRERGIELTRKWFEVVNIPVELRDADMLIIHPTGTSIRYLFTGQALIYVPTVDDQKNLFETDLPVWEVSSQQLGILRNAVPTFKEA